MMTTIDQLHAEHEALTKVYVVAVRLRQFPVPFAWREAIARKYPHVTVDVEQHYDDFCLTILDGLPSAQIAQAIADLKHAVEPRPRRSLRCWIFGCTPQGRCALFPYCTDCQGRCARCGRPIAPPAKVESRR